METETSNNPTTAFTVASFYAGLSRSRRVRGMGSMGKVKEEE